MKLIRLKTLFGVSEKKPDTYIRLEDVAKDKIKAIKSAVAQAETEQSIEALETLGISAIENEVISLSSRFQSLQNKHLHGILSEENYSLQINRIHHDILTLATRLEKNFEPERIIREIKVNLRKIYQKRLKDKLAGRQPINIQCVYTIEGTALERAQISYDEIVLEQKEAQGNLESLFDRHRGRLLIIGDPGSGKTSLLLQLADALLRRHENLVPLILNLSTWKNTSKTFEQWLYENVPRAASVSKAMAKSLVFEDRLLPLFDGLDEVSSDHRNSCLEAIAQYGREANHQYVICSRTAEYTQMAGAPVYGQIKLLPLTQEQIVQQLEQSTQPEARFLLHALRNQPVLAKVVETPYYFNTTQLLLSSMKSITELNIQANNEEDMKEELVDKFVVQQLNTTVKMGFPTGKSRRWLYYLSKKMEDNGLVVFELTDLRLGWLREKWVYLIINLSIIFLGAFFPFTKYENIYWFDALFISIFWIIFSYNRFNTYDRVTWNINQFRANFKNASIKFLIGSAILIPCLLRIGTIPTAIDDNAFNYMILILLLLSFIVVIGRSALLIFICFASLISINQIYSPSIRFTLLIILLVVLRVIRSGIKSKQLPNIDSPYKRFISLETLGIILSLYIIYYNIIMESSTFYDIENILGLIAFSIMAAPFSLIFRHFVIRLICAIKIDLPLRLATFLNEMTARHIFESDGGSWRFRHKILQDYFIQKHNLRLAKLKKV